MRAFIAIELPHELKNILAGLQNKLKTASADVKWVETQNIHLTLKFLGEVEDSLIPDINKVLEDTAGTNKHFPIRLSSLGAFPNIRSPRVIWAGIDKGDPEIKAIATRIEEKIAELGIAKEDKPFSSHITIGRVKTPVNRDKLEKIISDLKEGFREGSEFRISKITLFKSTLTPKGALYEAIKEVNLKAS